MSRPRGRKALRDDDINAIAHYPFRKRRELANIAFGVTKLKTHVTSFDITKVAQLGAHRTCPHRIINGRDVNNVRYFRVLLGVRSKRPHDSVAAEKHHEFTPFHTNRSQKSIIAVRAAQLKG